MGAVPIVLSGTLDELYRDAPVMRVRDYSDVSPQTLQTWKRTIWDRRAIWANTWFEKIRQEIRKGR